MGTYAGFWKRFVAYLIDTIIIGIVIAVPVIIMIAVGAGAGAAIEQNVEDSEAAAGLLGLIFGATMFVILACVVAE